jgi:hypothetical protein
MITSVAVRPEGWMLSRLATLSSPQATTTRLESGGLSASSAVLDPADRWAESPRTQVGDAAKPAQAEIPDVRAMLARNPRWSKLNLEINKAYIALAEQMQDIYDPKRELHPSWYGFAPYASRQAGSTIKRAEQLTALLERGEPMPPANPELEQDLARTEQQPDVLEVSRFLLHLYGVKETVSLGAGAIAHLVIAANRLCSLLVGQRGSLTQRLARVARTVRDMLEDGNRRIVAEIGVAGQDYLTFRQGRSPSPDQVLDEFHVDSAAPNPAQARAVFDRVSQVVRDGDPFILDWGREFPDPFPRGQFMVASFACYEAARLEPDIVLKNRWLDQAGILLAYREQHDSVQGAFDDSPHPGEVSRRSVMRMSTPWIGVPTHSTRWSFRRYANQQLPPLDHNPFTPRASEYNWSDFSTRWAAINDFFGQVLEQPSTLWPMPDPDPAVPLGQVPDGE